MTATIKRDPRNKGMRRVQISRAFMDTEMDDKDLVSMTERDYRLMRAVVRDATNGTSEQLRESLAAYNAPVKRK